MELGSGRGDIAIMLQTIFAIQHKKLRHTQGTYETEQTVNEQSCHFANIICNLFLLLFAIHVIL